MKLVTLALNSLDSSTWTNHEVDDLVCFLQTQFETFPETARIYHNAVSKDNDITPLSDEDIARISQLEGHFYIIVYPAAPSVIGLYVVVALLVVAAVTYKPPKPPQVAIRDNKVSSASPNNQLAERSNKVRLNGRVPSIYGTVKAFPDVIGVTYYEFFGSTTIEYGQYCIGEGYFDIEAINVKEGNLSLSSITGQSAEFYNPFETPNNSDVPFLQIGEPVGRNFKICEKLKIPQNMPLLHCYESGSNRMCATQPPTDNGHGFPSFFVNYSFGKYWITVRRDPVTNQAIFRFRNTVLGKPSSDLFVGNKIQISRNAGTVGIDDYGWKAYSGSTPLNAEYFGTYESGWDILNQGDGVEEGERFTITKVEVPDYSSVPYDLAEYTSLDCWTDWIMDDTIPDDYFFRMKDWDGVSYSDDQFANISLTLSSSFADVFKLDDDFYEEVWFNLTFPQGLYWDDGSEYKNNQSVAVIAEIGLEYESGVDYVVLNLSHIDKKTYGFSITTKLTFDEPAKMTSIVVYRPFDISNPEIGVNPAAVDICTLDSVYAFKSATGEFGNVCTTLTKTVANAAIAFAGEREYNILLTRKLPPYVDGTFSTNPDDFIPTRNAADIISAICLDPKIGNRQPSEVDFDSIYDACGPTGAVVDYFGTELAAEFSYTFDSDNLSFEEMIAQVAEAVFCKVYRQGNVIKMSFEKETANSVLLFNHRNKLPNTEVRTVNFGNKDYDGVSFQYIDPADDALETFYIPADKSAVRPLEIESIGIRSKLQAYFHAWREWNKIRYQNTAVEFTSTQEAEMLVEMDRILVSDNTRPETQDGEVIAQDGLEITLSQEVDLTVYLSYVIFLQLYDGSVESIGVTEGSAANKVILDSAPSLPLVVGSEYYARTTYEIVGASEPGTRAFLMTERSSLENLTCSVKAINYDDRYYQNDTDYINEIVDANGNLIVG